MRAETLEALAAAGRERRAAILVTDLESGDSRVVAEDGSFSEDPFGDELMARFRSGRSGLVESAHGKAMLTVRLPPPRLVIIGAVHIAQALAPMAGIAGLDVTIIDPRTGFAAVGRFPGARLYPIWPEEALAEVPLDAFTALAAMTHDPKIDDQPLAAALVAGCFYVGALGSRKTHAKRLDRLVSLGVDPVAAARIRAPIGLDIGAQSPAEIAVAVLAEVIEALRRRGGDT
ncbi:predicted sulfurylase large subunit, molybdopterin cytosine dinucleotide biosynthesis [Kaistia soli DSM 19436]|uniref:Predicted sulfurylase large subunit, molybdopterin cytosine dinucleotide biosynthesis n=1 Tax=Kaistia soli DSM 19436 TaxID=1122133 RepID=A0A1M5AFL8_9HYPH|nr:XdhC family protein [Kaistia soli]SHF28945.1 predicted sulfurylase large subunit, molybdopterin cytosine dinucleotide biosynthesis [Kaistia soli DSM 19436]